MWRTWIAHDIADGGDLAKALGRITAPTLVAASRTDLYFTPEDMADEAALVPQARFAVLESDWGHMAGSGLSSHGSDSIDKHLRDLLDRTSQLS